MKTQFLAALIGAAALLPGAAQTVDSVLTNGVAEPYSVAVQGNAYYISDSANHRIVAYTPGNGVVSSLAGFIGRPGSVDGKGVYARFNTPRGLLWVSALGGLVVADYGNQTLRLVKLDGKVTTLAGTPGIADLDPGPGPIPALSAHFNFPSALAADTNGNVFIADSKNNAIRRYDSINQLVWTVAQGIAQGLNQPNGIAVGDNGDLWVSNSRDHTIQRLVGGVPPAVLAAGTSGQSGALDSLFATQIPGFDVPGALFNYPGALLWLGTTNGLLVCDTGNHALRRVYQDPDIIGYSVSTYAGVLGQAGFANGPSFKPSLSPRLA
jgi:NHL repeat